jgi:integrase
VIVLLDALTGLRRGELMALKWQDASFEESKVAEMLRAGKGTKEKPLLDPRTFLRRL